MSELETLSWINKNLGKYITDACENTIYDLSWIAAIVQRETGGLIAHIVPRVMNFNILCQLMTGDFSKRKHDASPRYHGYGFTQIDVAAFPGFVASNDWQKPEKLFPFTIKVLESKRHYIINHFNDLTHQELERAITAAYNSGEGSVVKAIQNNEDVDIYTANHNYSEDVFRLRELFKTKILNDESI